MRVRAETFLGKELLPSFAEISHKTHPSQPTIYLFYSMLPRISPLLSDLSFNVAGYLSSSYYVVARVLRDGDD